MIGFIKGLWRIFNSPNNDPIIVSLIILVLTMLWGYIRNFLSNRKFLKMKDKRIEELVEEKNYYQEMILAKKRIKRKSSKKTKKKKKEGS